jgi:hypothetical protein
MTDDQTATALAFECGDPIQITTHNRTLTGVVYRCDHSEPELTCRGPEPGEVVLYVAIPSNELYRLQYTYYDEYDHTATRLDRYELTPEGTYTWVRTHADAVRVFFPPGSVRPRHDPQLNYHPNRSTAQGFEQEHPTNDSP